MGRWVRLVLHGCAGLPCACHPITACHQPGSPVPPAPCALQVLNCTEPSITYAKVPANFTSKFHSAPTFTSKECKVTKTFGESVEKVLFVFDGTQAPDMNTLVAKVRRRTTTLCPAAPRSRLPAALPAHCRYTALLSHRSLRRSRAC